jgi:cytochrome b561
VAKLTHRCLAWFCDALVGGNVLVALKHHFVDKNEILKGMLPVSKR